jgi:hypothetical protein
MTIELTEHEREILTELLEQAHRDKLHELHRTYSLGYKQLLRERIASLENLSAKVVVKETVG